jgi:hypothetical protein
VPTVASWSPGVARDRARTLTSRRGFGRRESRQAESGRPLPGVGYNCPPTRGSTGWPAGRLTIRRVLPVVAGICGALGLLRLRDLHAIRRHRRSLRTERTTGEQFDPNSIADLPPAAGRYLDHTVADRRLLARRVETRMRGEIRLGGGWRPFEAEEVLAARRGFVWRPRVRLGPGIRVSGGDFYVDGTGGRRFYLDGVVPVVRSDGPAVDRSAAGRFLAESVWLPTSLLPTLGAEWEDVSYRRARVTVPDVEEPLTVTVGEDGSLRSVEIRRFDAETGERRPFGAYVERERTVAGTTIPWELEAGWNVGTDEYEPFFRAELLEAVFR